MLLNFSLVLWTSVSAAPVCCTALGISDCSYWHIQDTSQRSKHCFLIGKGTINFWSSPGWLQRNIGGSTWKPMKVVCKFQRALSSNVFQRWTYNAQLRCHEGAFVGTSLSHLLCIYCGEWLGRVGSAPQLFFRVLKYFACSMGVWVL